MKEKKELYRRLPGMRSRFGFAIGIFMAVLCIFNVVQFIFMDNFYTYLKKQDMVKASEKIISLDFDGSSFYRDIANYEASYNIFVEIYHPKDVLVYTTNSNDWIYNSTASGEGSSGELKPRIMKILSHVDVSKTAFFELRQEFYASAQYIVYGVSGNDSTIDIYYSVDVIKTSAQTASVILFVISILLFLLFVLFTAVYSSTFILPIEKINSVTKEITAMDFSRTCPPFKVKDLNELSESVNKLSATLKLTLHDLESKNQRLESELQKGRRLEQARKQFIANASHELKTPISIIRGYAEGIKCCVDSSPDEYCDIIIDEAHKMNNLVIRLLEMTHYDSGTYEPNFVRFNIKEELQELVFARLRRMSELGITFQMNIDDDYIGLGDKAMLGDVFGNYISNAISHCAGEKKITVSCARHDSVYTVSVFNTGEQISSADMQHIWDSFYRADKAHSRQQGRFGLGLSIAAAAQKLQKQKYGVINRSDGVEFWFDIAKPEI